MNGMNTARIDWMAWTQQGLTECTLMHVVGLRVWTTSGCVGGREGREREREGWRERERGREGEREREREGGMEGEREGGGRGERERERDAGYSIWIEMEGKGTDWHVQWLFQTFPGVRKQDTQNQRWAICCLISIFHVHFKKVSKCMWN